MDEDGEDFRFRERPTILGPDGRPVVEPGSNAFFRWWLRLVHPPKKIIVIED